MSEPVRPEVPATEVEVDLAAFLPEGTTLAGDGAGEGEDGADDEGRAPEVDDGPEIPAWALDDAPADRGAPVAAPADGVAAPTVEPADHVAPEAAESAAEPAPEAVESPAEAAPAGVDLARLESLAADLAAVDRALDALDTGTPERSPLLADLLGADPAP